MANKNLELINEKIRDDALKNVLFNYNVDSPTFLSSNSEYINYFYNIMMVSAAVIYKAYIDFSNFSDRNITHDDGTNIKLVLPDPLIELTSSKVEHDAIRRNEELLAESLPEADADKLSKQAMDDIWATLDYSSIVERAKQDAIDKIAPLFYHLGYNSVTMDFASEQSILDNITQFLDFSKLNI